MCWYLMSVMSGQQFCLKWNNYQSNMSEVFQSMLISESLVDCTLACEGENLKVRHIVFRVKLFPVAFMFQ